MGFTGFGGYKIVGFEAISGSSGVAAEGGGVKRCWITGLSDIGLEY